MNKQFKQHKSIVPGNPASTKVVNRDISFAIRNWKKQTKASGILDILKSIKDSNLLGFFINPSCKSECGAIKKMASFIPI